MGGGLGRPRLEGFSVSSSALMSRIHFEDVEQLERMKKLSKTNSA